uniref:Uncharacterized protein n=1 Tax=Oryza glumipatula TaxID=40148 RepID=A0A0D9Z5E0_9ORYZ
MRTLPVSPSPLLFLLRPSQPPSPNLSNGISQRRGNVNRGIRASEADFAGIKKKGDKGETNLTMATALARPPCVSVEVWPVVMRSTAVSVLTSPLPLLALSERKAVPHAAATREEAMTRTSTRTTQCAIAAMDRVLAHLTAGRSSPCTSSPSRAARGPPPTAPPMPACFRCQDLEKDETWQPEEEQNEREGADGWGPCCFPRGHAT